MRTRTFWNELALVAIAGISCWGCTLTSTTLAGTGGDMGAGGDTGAGGAAPITDPTTWPCDLYAADGGPCVAAHSMVRALSHAYGGPLYQVKKMDGTTK